MLLQDGLVYAVEFSHRSGRDLVNMAKKRGRQAPSKVPDAGWHGWCYLLWCCIARPGISTISLRQVSESLDYHIVELSVVYFPAFMFSWFWFGNIGLSKWWAYSDSPSGHQLDDADSSFWCLLCSMPNFYLYYFFLLFPFYFCISISSVCFLDYVTFDDPAFFYGSEFML